MLQSTICKCQHATQTTGDAQTTDNQQHTVKSNLALAFRGSPMGTIRSSHHGRGQKKHGGVGLRLAGRMPGAFCSTKRRI